MDNSRALPVPRNPQNDAERYLSLVHTSSQRIPDILVMPLPPEPSPLMFPHTHSVPSQLSSTLDKAMVSHILASFTATREQIATLSLQVAKGSSLPLASQHVCRRLTHCGDPAWRFACFGATYKNNEADEGYFEASDEQESRIIQDLSLPTTTQVWFAEEEVDFELNTAIPPLLSYLVGLDQVSITRALTRMVRRLDEERSQTIPLSEAVWLYSLLAALQTPILDNTTATVRQLYVLLQTSISGCSCPSMGPALVLGIVTGTYFGQS